MSSLLIIKTAPCLVLYRLNTSKLLAILPQEANRAVVFIIYIWYMKKYLAEAIGTFFLVLVAGMSGDAFTIGIILAIVVYATAAISG